MKRVVRIDGAEFIRGATELRVVLKTNERYGKENYSLGSSSRNILSIWKLTKRFR